MLCIKNQRSISKVIHNLRCKQSFHLNRLKTKIYYSNQQNPVPKKKINNVSVKPLSQPQKTNHIIDNGIYVFATCMFSAVMVLSACIVMILTARETQMESIQLKDKYDKVYEEVHHLEDKILDDEQMLNAVVNTIVQLKSIGIV